MISQNFPPAAGYEGGKATVCGSAYLMNVRPKTWILETGFLKTNYDNQQLRLSAINNDSTVTARVCAPDSQARVGSPQWLLLRIRFSNIPVHAEWLADSKQVWDQLRFHLATKSQIKKKKRHKRL